jgi:hypothetical protein
MKAASFEIFRDVLIIGSSKYSLLPAGNRGWLADRVLFCYVIKRGGFDEAQNFA